MRKARSNTVYAFIDTQNLKLGIRGQGWELDYKKLRIYLKDKYLVEKAFLFMGYIEEYKDFYSKLESYGYIIIFKQTHRGIGGKFKGNVDAELVLYSCAKLIDEYDKAILISGDGDFFCLIDYLLSKNKFSRLLIPNRKGMSKLLWVFSKYTDYLENLKMKIGK